MKKNSGLLLIALLVLIFTLTACGGSSKSAASVSSYTMLNSTDSYETSEYAFSEYSSEAYDEYKSEYYENESDVQSEIFNDSARKLIKTYSIDVETEDFDNLLLALNDRISSLGGYIEKLDTYNGSSYKAYRSNRYSNLTVRIPSKNIDKFVEYVGETSNVTSKNLSVSDVTLSYVDTESKKETYLIEQERLLSMLEKCETVEDMIAIESRLSEVRYKIESMESQLRTYDNLVDYSTVNLYINEVEKYTEPEPVSYFEEVARSFENGVEDVWNGLKTFFVNFVGVLPSLVVFAIIVVIVVFIVKAIRKGNKNKRDKKRNDEALRRMEEAKAKAEKKAIENAE